jgi:DNA-binding response OmpR family regulator
MDAPAERILVVEDDLDISDLIIREALQPLGYQTRLAADSRVNARLFEAMRSASASIDHVLALSVGDNQP